MKSLSNTRPRGRLTLALALLLLAVASASVAEWSQWRGPEGSGVALHGVSLPEQWEAGSPNVRWSTTIPGEGISSPVVSGDRVFLTTGYESPTRLRLRAISVYSIAALGAVFLLLVLGWVSRRGDRPRAGRKDRGFVALFSVGFAVAASYIAMAPEQFMDVSYPGRAYRIGGGVALLGLGAAFGWFDRRSKARRWGAVLLLLGIATFLAFMPASSRGPTPLSKSLPFVLPAIIMMVWYTLGSRKPTVAGETVSTGGWKAAVLTAMACLFYLSINVLSGFDRVVVALDATSGELLWQESVFTGPPERKWERSSFATPTPVADGETVWAYFGPGVAALDFDGDVLWSEDFPDYTQRTRYGATASPVLHGGSILLGREAELNHPDDDSWLGAWDKDSGEPLWWQVVDDARDSYATPMIYASDGVTQTIHASWQKLVSYDANSGDRLWEIEYPMEQLVASMARRDDVLAVTGGAYGDRFLVVYRLVPGGAAPGVEELWRTNRSVAAIASPVIYDGKLFTVSVPGIMTAFEVETGAQLWKKRLGGEHFASLVAGDGKVYAISIEGTVTVIDAAEPEVIAINELESAVYASPAISDCLLIRTATELLCVEGEGEGGGAVAAELAVAAAESR